ncbi:insulinase family protein [Candidatus Dojkabacteria bacterium]|nr:insulinase family protein [Candidatus Dojkabacteria bacterium]
MINPLLCKNTDIPITIIYPLESKALSVMVLVRTGSRYENESINGISHFIEHMLFKSTKKRPNSKLITMDIEMMGGITNAFTSYDFTGYYIKSAAKEFSKSIEILGDIINNTVFKKDEFIKERGVILEEIKMYKDRPASRVALNWKKEFYKDHPLGRDIAGSIKSVKDLKIEDLENYYTKNYFNSNYVICLAGNVPKSEVVIKEIQKNFINQNRINISNDCEKVTNVNPSGVIVEKLDLQQAHIYMGMEVGKKEFNKEIESELLNVIISEGFGSRLFQKLRDEMGIAYYLYSDFTLFDDSGRMNIGFGTDLKKIEKVIEEVIKELNKLIKCGVTQTELIRAKKYYISKLLFDTEGSDDLASWVGINYIENNRLVTMDEVIKKINKLTIQEINTYINNEFSGKSLLISILGNIKKDFDNKFSLKLD